LWQQEIRQRSNVRSARLSGGPGSGTPSLTLAPFRSPERLQHTLGEAYVLGLKLSAEQGSLRSDLGNLLPSGSFSGGPQSECFHGHSSLPGQVRKVYFLRLRGPVDVLDLRRFPSGWKARPSSQTTLY
jgi:hypothetical protein